MTQSLQFFFIAYLMFFDMNFNAVSSHTLGFENVSVIIDVSMKETDFYQDTAYYCCHPSKNI